MSKSIIFAQSTPPGNGGISIIRISGDNCLPFALSFFKSNKITKESDILPNFMYFGNIQIDSISDKGYLVFFKAPFSFTGEDTVEFHCHGGRRLIVAFLESLACHGAKMASPGEFTKRAFLNGKVSLSDAEGIMSIINAESAFALKMASRMMNGDLSKTVFNMQDVVLKIIADLEAALDYPDEIDPLSFSETHFLQLKEIYHTLKKLLSSYKNSAFIRKGISIVLSGAPNVGKSSLLNSILKKERAIVTDIPGTTRDTIQESFEHNGFLFNITDTAGLRESENINEIEKLGIDRSYQAVKCADVILYVLDVSLFIKNLESSKTAFLNFVSSLKNFNRSHIIIVLNKYDLLSPDQKVLIENTAKKLFSKFNIFFTSAIQNDGISSLLSFISHLFINNEKIEDEPFINARHLSVFKKVEVSISSAINGINEKIPIECLLIDLRNAWHNLGEITGKTASADIIDKIFSEFCLGK